MRNIFSKKLSNKIRLQLAAVCLALFSLQTAQADTIIAAEAVHVDKKQAESEIRLRWISTPSDMPVDVFVSTEPDSQLDDMQLLASNITDNQFTTNDFKGQRIYFALSYQASDEPVRVAPRLLPLEGGRNFRDIGGYTNKDGRKVKWGHVFRSGMMSGLTDDDYKYLAPIGIANLVDFRSNEERDTDPTVWRAGKPSVYSRDYSEMGSDKGSSELIEVFTSGTATAEDMKAVMRDSYYQIGLDQAESYTVLFDKLANSDAPLAFNCSAGKDRAGIAAALVLSALEVPRETIIDDYTLSDDYVDYIAEFTKRSTEKDSPYEFLANIPPEVLEPMMASDREYIEVALAQLDKRYGSVINFIQDELDVSDTELASIRARLLSN